jgi:hypothetical protein
MGESLRRSDDFVVGVGNGKETITARPVRTSEPRIGQSRESAQYHHKQGETHRKQTQAE